MRELHLQREDLDETNEWPLGAFLPRLPRRAFNGGLFVAVSEPA